MLDGNNDIRRRKFLKTTGTLVTAGGLAGCSGGGSSAGSGDGSGNGGDGSGGAKTTKQMSLVEKAQEEGKLTFVGSFVGIGDFWKGFTDKYGIEVQFQFRDAKKTATKILQNRKSGNQTIDISGDQYLGSPITAATIVNMGIFRQLPQSFVDQFEQYTEPWADRRLLKFGEIPALRMLYNTDMINSPPASTEELFTSKFKNKIMVDVRDSELIPLGRRQYDSESELKNYIQSLANHATWIESHFDMANQIAQGENPIGLTYQDYTEYDFGKNLAVAEIPGTVVSGGAPNVGITKDAPHPNAAKLGFKYMFEDNRLLNYLNENYATYYPKGEWNQIPDDQIISVDEAAKLDGKEISQTWKQWTGLRQGGQLQ